MKVIALLLFLSIAPIPAAYAFDTISTRHFVFYVQPENRQAASYLARQADGLLDSMSQLLGIKLGEVVRVYIVQDLEPFYREQPQAGRLPSWAAGAAWPDKNLIVLLLRRGDIDKTFLHEINHVLLGQAFKGFERVPRWLAEGLAMMWADEWSVQRLTTMTMAVLSRNTLPMDEIAESFPADMQTAEIAYCQSFYFISFLKREFGAEAFQRFFQEYAKYRDFKGALRLAYQMEWHELDRLWRRYLALHFSWLPLITSTSTVWFLATVLFIAGYVRKKYQGRKKLLQWQAEEAARPGPTLH